MMPLHSTFEEFLLSGLPEAYAMGVAAETECAEVEHWMASHPALREEIASMEEALERMAFAGAIPPPPTVKPLVPATLRFLEQVENGTLLPMPVPELGPHSKPADYREWIEHPLYQAPEELGDYHAHIIGVSDTTHSLIVWLRDGAPLENHSHQVEKFLILEGTCEIVIGEKVHMLGPGDFLAITPDHPHFVKVTSDHPCKIVLQRTAA
jgi:mannose-6-phosphate isomerase-like protein (cupin superfamily)